MYGNLYFCSPAWEDAEVLRHTGISESCEARAESDLSQRLRARGDCTTAMLSHLCCTRQSCLLTTCKGTRGSYSSSCI